MSVIRNVQSVIQSCPHIPADAFANVPNSPCWFLEKIFCIVLRSSLSFPD